MDSWTRRATGSTVRTYTMGRSEIAYDLTEEDEDIEAFAQQRWLWDAISES